MWAAISKHASYSKATNIALCDDTQSVTYFELAERVKVSANYLQKLKLSHTLCAFVFTPTVDTVVQYLACYYAKVPVLLLDPEVTQEVLTELELRYRFAAIFCDEQWQVRQNSVTQVRADLQLLLTTSGSTGAPKCVMLSNQNLLSNAESIIDYLHLNSNDVGISSMPMHYSFGMSLLHTHLVAGATFVLTTESFVSRRFWELVEHHKVTSISGVPFSFQMLKTIKFSQMPLSSIRYLTQAGGRLPLPLAKYFLDLCAERGWDFYQMYGQTEAAPRIAYLPPSSTIEHRDCIGIAVPQGRLFLRDFTTGDVITDANVEGELCYSGPNVMLGYAIDSEGLVGADCIEELRTGDIAERLTNGFFRITGRSSRFVKIRGKRMSLDHIEQVLHEKGIEDVMVGGQDDLLVIAVTNDDAQDIAKCYLSELKLHPTLFNLLLCNDLPRSSNNKANYSALMNMVKGL